jgi:uncharacterized protein (DUF488 family)
MKPKIVTIGVYGSDESSFFRALVDAKVDTFCDIRRRRGVRGAQYAYVNSLRLQQKVNEMGMRYLHFLELAPSQKVRDEQKEEDARTHVAKRSREHLTDTFVKAYQSDCLARFDATKFLRELAPDARVVALFCVERTAEACHRSLAAEHLQRELGVPVEHLLP